MAIFYSSAAAVLTRTGIDPADLGLGTDEELAEFLEALLAEVSDLIDRSMGRSYLTSTIPAGLAGIAADIAASSVREMVATRQSPVVRIDDFAVRTISAQMFSSDITKRLALYGAGSRAASLDIATTDLEAADWDWSESE
jgi:hypothetical protein